MPMWLVMPRCSAAATSAAVHEKSATAGYSSGAKCWLAPSSRTAPVVTMTSATSMSLWIAPVVPTRRNVRTPSCASSSVAIDVDGPPMPVEQTTIGRVVGEGEVAGELAIGGEWRRAFEIARDLRRPAPGRPA